MAFWEDLAERMGGGAGLGAGIAAAALAPTLIPLASRGLRPVVKSIIKGYLRLTMRTRATIAGAGECLQDLYAEAKSEVHPSSALPTEG